MNRQETTETVDDDETFIIDPNTLSDRELRKYKREIKLQAEIYQHYINEEKEYEEQLENQQLKSPCKCESLCDYNRVLQRQMNGFNKLYKAYEKNYVDYYNLYINNEIIVKQKKEIIQFPKYIKKILNQSNNSNNFYDNLKELSNLIKKLYKPSIQTSINNENRIDLATFNYYANEYEDEFINSLYYISNDELDEINYIRILTKLQVLKRKRFGVIRLINWLLDCIIGRKRCICIHCTARENLEIVRNACIKLYNEYINIYLDIISMIYAEEIESVNDDHKLIIPSDDFHQVQPEIVKFFNNSLDNLIE